MSIFDVMLDLAQKKGRNLNLQQEYQEKKIKNQFLPRSLQLEQMVNEKRIPLLEAQTGLTNARIGKIPFEEKLLMAQIEQAKANQALSNYRMQNPGFQGAFAKAAIDLQRLKQLYGDDNPMVKLGEQNLQRLAQGSHGISISRGPNGEEQIQIGGPRSGQGAMFMDQQGNVQITPTAATENQLQQQLIDQTEIGETLKELSTSFAPYLGLKGNLRQLGDSIKNYTGDKSVKAFVDAKTGKDLISFGADRLMKALKLPRSIEAYNEMKRVLTPDKFDNAQSYVDRVVRHINRTLKEQKRTEGYMIKGFRFDPKNQYVPQLEFLTPETEKMKTDSTIDRYQAIQAEIEKRKKMGSKNG